MKAKSRRRKPLPNGSRATMADRKEPDDSLDFFPTPPYATRALMERVFPRLPLGEFGHACRSAWEPACGEGHMAEVLKEYFAHVYKTDVHQYGDHDLFDFLNRMLPPPTFYPFDWIITNPPFKIGLDFTLRALELAQVGVAMFMRVQFLETIERYDRLFSPHPPTTVAFFVERIPICKGQWDPDGTTATAYCWLVWVKGREPMPPFWIPPGQRRALTRPDDRARFAAWSLPQAEAAE